MPSAAPSNETLFTPLKVGDIEIAHRLVLAPLTRMRADTKHVLGGVLNRLDNRAERS